jgi:hypothetical protein
LPTPTVDTPAGGEGGFVHCTGSTAVSVKGMMKRRIRPEEVSPTRHWGSLVGDAHQVGSHSNRVSMEAQYELPKPLVLASKDEYVEPEKEEGDRRHEGPEEVDDQEDYAVEDPDSKLRSLGFLHEIRIEADRIHGELPTLDGRGRPTTLAAEGDVVGDFFAAEPTVRRITEGESPKEAIKIYRENSFLKCEKGGHVRAFSDISKEDVSTFK